MATVDLGRVVGARDGGNAETLGGKVPEYYIQPHNLLDNSNFRNPVNQRGKTSYSEDGRSIDRWGIYGYGGAPTSVTINDGYITLESDNVWSSISQKVALPQGTYTFAYQTVGGGINVQQANYNASANVYQCEIYASGGKIDIEWAALYEGTYTADNLPPYTPKGYATELLACMISEYGAGVHNAVYRGAYLGSAVTDAQYAAIDAGTFENLFIGDYWTIDGVNYRIAAFDYYLNTGDSLCSDHHVTIVPDAPLSKGVAMNASTTTNGAYALSKMYAEGLTQAKETITAAFGLAHLMTHRSYFHNAVTDGYASGGSWYDSTVDLMNEQNVYGCRVYGNAINGTNLPDNDTVDKTQFPLFKFNPSLIANGNWIWLRDVASSDRFANVGRDGYADASPAHYGYDVRPAFSIIG